MYSKIIVKTLLLFFIFSIELSAQNFNRTRTFDVRHYKIQISFDRGKRQVFGDTIVSLKPLGENFKTIELDAAGMTFEFVRLANENKDLKYKMSGEKIFIELDKAYKPADLIAIRFKYSCRPKKGITFVDERKDGKKIIHSAQIWTQGEPDEAHHWFPSYDFPDDKATSEQIITANSDENVIANGELVEKKDNGNGTATSHFKMPLPHSTYLTSFIVGKYAKTEDKYKNIPLGVYVYPGEESVIPLAFSDTKEMLRIFEEATKIDYPFNKYDQTMVADFTFGGMENITATTYSDNEIFLAKFPHVRGFILDLVSHELAHSWFGNLVTCRNWAELWLNEGFATYMEAVYRGKMYGKNAYISKIREDATTYLTGDAANNTRHGLFNQTANDLDKLFKYPNITYNKGSLVIHLLHETVGDEAFWKAVNIYLTRHKFSNVETNDLKKVFEEVSGKNLDRFFQQWVYGVGHPKLEIEPLYVQEKNEIVMTITQVQKGENVPDVFIFPLEIFIQTKSGEKIENIIIDKRSQEFTIKVDGYPTNITLDKSTKMPLMNSKIEKVKTLRF